MPTAGAFTTWDGIEIAYQEWGTGAAGASPPVLLHHGFAVDATTNWAAPGVVDALVAAGRRVIAPDARGHGRSEKPRDPGSYGEQNMARDVACLLEEAGLSEIDLVGYSMGAVVSLIFASGDRRVRRLVVGGVGSGIIECGGVDRRAISNDSIIEALAADDPATIQAPGAAAFRRLADAVGADRGALIAQARAIHRGHIPVDRITAPALVLAGDADPLAVRPQVLAAAIPQARLQMVSGDHLAAVADPLFARAIVEFVS